MNVFLIKKFRHTLFITTSLLFLLSPAQGFDLFPGGSRDAIPPREELIAQEKMGSQLLQKAHQLSNEEKIRKAFSLYKKIAKKYPYTTSGAEAQFHVARIYQEDSQVKDAFEAYQQLIEKYPGSPRFSQAIEQQFQLAQNSVDEKTGKLLFISRKLPRNRIIEMLHTIIENAPRSKYAPKAQFLIAELQQDLGDADKAAQSYQELVERYPKSKEAGEAAYRTGAIRSIDASRGNDQIEVTEARTALEDYIGRYGDDQARVTQARQHLEQLSSQDAEKSFKIARFYEKKGKLKAAAIYYREVAQSTASEYQQEAIERLTALGEEAPEIAEMENTVFASAPTRANTSLNQRPDFIGPPIPNFTALNQQPQARTGSPLPIEEPSLPDQSGAAEPLLPLPEAPELSEEAVVPPEPEEVFAPAENQKILVPPTPEEEAQSPEIIIPDTPNIESTEAPIPPTPEAQEENIAE